MLSQKAILPHYAKIGWQVTKIGGLSILYIKFIYSENHSDFRHCDFNFVKGDISMNIIEKSESIRTGLRKGFQDGPTQMLWLWHWSGWCVGGQPQWGERCPLDFWPLSQRWQSGQNRCWQSIPSPTGKPKWSREAISKLISNEKYTGRVLLQKTISAGGTQIKNDGFMERYLYSDSHEAIISDEIFRDAQQKKLQRTNQPEKEPSIQPFF